MKDIDNYCCRNDNKRVFMSKPGDVGGNRKYYLIIVEKDLLRKGHGLRLRSTPPLSTPWRVFCFVIFWVVARIGALTLCHIGF